MHLKKESLKPLLELCISGSENEKTHAWNELLHRYERLLIYFIDRRVSSWNMPRLGLQKEEIVEDVFSEVLVILYNKLATFKNREQEYKFKSWLEVICRNATGRYISKTFSTAEESYVPEVHNDKEECCPDGNNWELYERTQSLLQRALVKGKNIERDKHIFLLNVWAGFPARQITAHPLYTTLSLNQVEVIISRIKKKIKEDNGV